MKPLKRGNVSLALRLMMAGLCLAAACRLDRAGPEDARTPLATASEVARDACTTVEIARGALPLVGSILDIARGGADGEVMTRIERLGAGVSTLTCAISTALAHLEPHVAPQPAGAPAASPNPDDVVAAGRLRQYVRSHLCVDGGASGSVCR